MKATQAHSPIEFWFDFASGYAYFAALVFGSPWIFVEGEPFWGSDRLAMVEQWLANGPYWKHPHSESVERTMFAMCRLRQR
jgi:2-hydroxychromene-2-carboxylate isomerase